MPDGLLAIMGGYQNYVMRGDGEPEINSLRYASFEPAGDVVPRTARLALVLVEPRILAPVAGLPAGEDLLPRLARWKGDLRAEGLYSRFIVADVYSGPDPKDGSTLLALRRFLRDVRAAYPNLEGVVLVGSFPEASLVRRIAWAPDFDVDLLGRHHSGERYVAISPEEVATRSEVVLADLTGNWETLYRYPSVDIENIVAFPDAATTARGWSDGSVLRDGTVTSTDFDITTQTFQDCFYIDDAVFTINTRTVTPTGRSLSVTVHNRLRNPETEPADLSAANVLARPDIAVSRINARNIALNPDPSLHGDDGQGFLDAAGNPRTFTSTRELYDAGNEATMFTSRDAALERRLYNGYFDRNHRFRVGAWSNLPFRTGAISGTTDFRAADYASLLNEAATDFAPGLVRENATLLEYTRFLKQPAVLRYLMAHSNMWNSQFGDGYATADLEAEIGGPPIRWTREGTTYRPSMAGQGGGADLFLHRALWRNHTLDAAGASVVIHGGCEVDSVYGTTQWPYSSPNYGGWQNGEGVLFFTNTVALFSRAKVFNDDPWGFPQGFRTSARANVGACWKSYFNAQAADAGVASDFAQNKRAYFWSLGGDWTVRLRNKNGIGIVSSGPALTSEQVHPNGAWIGDWNFDGGAGTIRGIGDVDGDGIDEFVIRSDWGVGVLKHDGTVWQPLVVAPRDTWFGDWRYDATVNTGRDVIQRVGNFTGTSAKEILVTSSWGLGVLGLAGTSLTSTSVHASGTRLGDWVWDSTADRIVGVGDFDGDGHDEILVVSDWGLGIVSLATGRSLVAVANGTRCGGWLLDTAKNTLRLVADVDGDGRAEIVVSSPWGIGVLKLAGTTLTSVALHANGTGLGGYTVNGGDRFQAADRFRGLSGAELLVMNDAGLHLLALSGGGLTRVGSIGAGARVDGWLFDPRSNDVLCTGALSGTARREFVVSSPWGVGVLGFDETGRPAGRTLHPYGAMLGDWHLESADRVVGTGNLTGSPARAELLLVKTTS